MVWRITKENFWKFYWSFHNSEVIMWARIQLFVGVVWTVLSTTDLAPLISNPKYLTYWLILNGVVTEMLRRHKADFKSSDTSAPPPPAGEKPCSPQS